MPHVDEGTLNAYLDGELSPPEAQSVETHLAQCAGCRARWEEERGLITRAAELLARAAPPDRELPPFRTGAVTLPARLWWRVRLPLAWAASVALALGAGAYLGPRLARRGPEPEARAESKPANQVIPQAAPAPRGPARDAAQAPRREADRRRAAKQAAAPAPLAASDQVGRPQAAAEPEHAGAAMKSARRSDALDRTTIDADSARLVLGTDPLAVPDVPVRGMYRVRLPGYSTAVVVEQTLDSNTVIEVITGRPAPPPVAGGAVTGAAAGAVRADSLAAVPRQRAAAPAAAPHADESAPDLLLEVRGPLSADSLAALRRRLRALPR